MKCVVLQDMEGMRLGFLLSSKELDEPAGECVFMIIPADANLNESPSADLLWQRRAVGESAWRAIGRAPRSLAIKTPGVTDELFVDIRAEGDGTWGIVQGGERKVLGLAQASKRVPHDASSRREGD